MEMYLGPYVLAMAVGKIEKIPEKVKKMRHTHMKNMASPPLVHR